MLEIGFLDERKDNYENKRLLYMKIQKYVKLMIKNNNEYEFTYKFNDTKYKIFNHRYVCSENIQSIPSKCRGFLMKHTTDIDMSNCHIVIFKYICSKLGIETPKLDYYINNKELVRNLIEPDYQNIKMLIISFLNSYTLKKKLANKYLRELDLEIKLIQKKIIESKVYDDIYQETIRNSEEETDEYKIKNINGRFMSSLGISYEVRIIKDLMEYLVERGIKINTYMYDGLMVNGNYYEDFELLEEITNYINNKYPGLSSEWTYKYHDNSIYMSEDFELNDMDHLCYHKYEKLDIDIHTHQPDMTINREKLGYDFFKEIINRKTKYYMIKSDMGTGKTSSFISYLKNNRCINYISILSRISLCDYMVDTLNKNKLHATHYKNLSRGSSPSRGYVFQIESLFKLEHCWNILNTDFVLFIDEIKSFLYHLYESCTLEKIRISCMNLLCHVIKRARYVICVDAHMNDFCIDFINFINKYNDDDDKILFVENEYINNRNIDAEELKDEKQLLNLLEENDKWLLVSDSKTFSKFVYKKLNDENIKIYTSDEGNIKIDLSHDKVIISPKVIYGLDSNIERPVFVYNAENTIDPECMLQQINRERQKTKLYFLFTRKAYNTPLYMSLEDCISQNDKIYNEKSNMYRIMYNSFRSEENIDLITFYNSQCNKLKYIRDTYDSNPFKHFIEIIKTNGFNLLENKFKRYTPDGDERKLNTFIKEELLQEKLNNFDNFIENNHLDFMNIDNNIEDELKEIVVDKKKLEQHFTISAYFFNNNNLEDGIMRLHHKDDFFLNCIGSVQDRLNFLYKVNEILETTDKNRFQFKKIITEIPKETRLELGNEYSITFPNRCKKKEFDYNKLNNILSVLFGDMYSLKRKEKKIDNKRYTYYKYEILEDILEIHYNLYKYRHQSECSLAEYMKK